MAARILALVAAACYSGWLLSTSTAPARTSYLSELAVAGQPGAGLLRALDLVAGLSVLLGTLLAARAGWPPGRTLRVATLAGLTVFGAATVLDALFPLACAPTLSAACHAADLAGELPWAHQVHGVTSALSGGGALLGILGVAATVRRPDAEHPRRVGIVYGALASFATVTTLWVLIEIVGAGQLPGVPRVPSAGALGWSQRAQLLTVSLWLVALGLLPPLRRQVRPA